MGYVPPPLMSYRIYRRMEDYVQRSYFISVDKFIVGISDIPVRDKMGLSNIKVNFLSTVRFIPDEVSDEVSFKIIEGSCCGNTIRAIEVPTIVHAYTYIKGFSQDFSDECEREIVRKFNYSIKEEIRNKDVKWVPCKKKEGLRDIML